LVVMKPSPTTDSVAMLYFLSVTVQVVRRIELGKFMLFCLGSIRILSSRHESVNSMASTRGAPKGSERIVPELSR
jgi:hypothetical protein